MLRLLWKRGTQQKRANHVQSHSFPHFSASTATATSYGQLLHTPERISSPRRLRSASPGKASCPKNEIPCSCGVESRDGAVRGRTGMFGTRHSPSLVSRTEPCRQGLEAYSTFKEVVTCEHRVRHDIAVSYITSCINACAGSSSSAAGSPHAPEPTQSETDCGTTSTVDNSLRTVHTQHRLRLALCLSHRF